MTLALLRLLNQFLKSFSFMGKKKQSPHVFLLTYFVVVALIGALAVSFTPRYGGKEALKTNYIQSKSLANQRRWFFLCVYVGLCIYTYSSRHSMCVLRSLLRLGKLDPRSDC